MASSRRVRVLPRSLHVFVLPAIIRHVARERIISQQSIGHDEDAFNLSLRPQRLDEVIGQRALIEQLRIALEASKARSEPMDHVLLAGPPGLGKTTFAHVIANELGATIRITSGPAISKPGDLMHWLTEMKRGDVLFIDEIHRLSKPVEEFLYSAMEDFRVDFTIDSGISGRTVNIPLKPFTLIGATTRSGLLTGALRDRFGMLFHFDFYQQEDLAEILARSAGKLKVPAEAAALATIAGRSRGTPRVANRLLKRTRDFAQVRAEGRLTPEVVDKALDLQGIDKLGLDDLDRAFLSTLIQVYRGGPAGIEALAATLGQERDTLEDVVEPYLLQIGFVIRTKQGRVATQAGYGHLGIPYAAPGQPVSEVQGQLFDES
ncbi:MAG TPA: Holliday junction branch migration DNA helicase RuvB [Phycisphaerae bacterium]|nr:Holliday junction branch migration DNA helicase RuvB [Phycisphaerae bacterium]HRY68573.1 Holliday junction branch migration DNA helicase RuvB [Phycisphaerae bacterium]HSA25622.1 Holliday junction branch migration DNA helicase RuvB [Phycisphaerae bacterium]